MTRLVLSEVFGPTLQGEGPAAGRRAVFVRLGLCNLHCSWCDTPFTWDWTGRNGVAYDKGSLRRPHVLTIMQEATALYRPDLTVDQPVPLLVISGGEPLLQKHGVGELASFWPGEVNVETNGTLGYDDRALDSVDVFVVSPKLLNAGMDADVTMPEAPLRSFVELDHDRAVFKFVVTGDDDLAEVAAFVDRFDVAPSRVWLMPEGRSSQELAGRHRFVFDAAVAAGYNACTRLHVLAHEDKRQV